MKKHRARQKHFEWGFGFGLGGAPVLTGSETVKE